jgi:hypothetical protein
MIWAGIFWVSGLFRSPWAALAFTQFFAAFFLTVELIKAQFSHAFEIWDATVFFRIAIGALSWGIFWFALKKYEREEMEEVKKHIEQVGRSMAQRRDSAPND